MVPMKLQIQDSFYLEEKRCDYLVSSNLKKIWAIELDLLSEFLFFCKKNDIKVIVWAGTLLGAVRHKGFIPWDDDVDVAMTRDEFSKLLKICEQKQFSYPYFLQTAKNDRLFFFGYARFRNSMTTGIIRDNYSPDYNNGIYIDIFVLDGYPEEEKKEKKQIKKRTFCEALINIGYSCTGYKSKNRIKQLLRPLVSKCIKLFFSYDFLIEMYTKTLSRYDKSKKIGMLTHPDVFREKYWCYREDLLEVEEIDFEMIKVPVPKSYDKILKTMYGDYMTFPPKEKRGFWHNGLIIFDPNVSYKEYFRNK